MSIIQMLHRLCRRGPVRDKWISLNLVPDQTQLRAVTIVDEFAHSKLRFHKSSVSHVSGPEFDLSLFHFTETSTDESHEKVAQYTRSMAEQNKRLLQAQKARAQSSKDVSSDTASSSSYRPPLQHSPPHSVTPIQSPAVSSPNVPKAPVPSLYLFGSVGRGKTMLMNILTACMPRSIRSSRYHFFELMKKVHADMAAGKTVVEIANAIADANDVLYIDELAITDIQDATILPALMSVLVRRRVALIMTSNQHPQSLYTNGLNRHIYLPPLLKILRESACRLISLDNDENDNGDQIDYRTFAASSENHIGDENRLWKWTTSVPSSTSPKSNFRLALSATRNMQLSETSNGFSVSTSYLTNDQFSDSDYVKLADFIGSKKILKIIVDTKFFAADILGPARRFGKLVEILYDKKTNVEFLSLIPVNALFEKSQVQDLMDTGVIGENLNSIASPLAAASVDEGIRSIERCLSRLSQAARNSES